MILLDHSTQLGSPLDNYSSLILLCIVFACVCVCVIVVHACICRKFIQTFDLRLVHDGQQGVYAHERWDASPTTGTKLWCALCSVARGKRTKERNTFQDVRLGGVQESSFQLFSWEESPAALVSVGAVLCEEETFSDCATCT